MTWLEQFEEWSTCRPWELDKDKFYVDVSVKELEKFIRRVERDTIERCAKEAEKKRTMFLRKQDMFDLDETLAIRKQMRTEVAKAIRNLKS